jgi:chorismate synthase
MGKLRFFTAGESHGTALIGIIEGIPANLPFSSEEIDRDLKRRQGGFGRGGRMKIESDRGKILSGIRWGKTMGSPLTIMIENRDFSNWMEGMSVDAGDEGSIPPVTRPRPGHADLAGSLKYNQRDIRNILERSSARETAMRVALGAVAKRFLADFGVSIGSYVTQIGNQKSEVRNKVGKEVFINLFQKAETSSVRCPDERTSERMVALIEKAIREGDSLGGVFEVFALDVPIGLGSHVQWDRRIDGRLAQAIMSIQAIKGVEIGPGFEMAGCTGSEVMDDILYEEGHGGVHARKGFYRETNNTGGIEGGMTNGMPVFLRAAMKPIPTLKKPLRSVDIITKEPFEAAYERSDVCAVPAASVVSEAMTALVLAGAFLEKFGGDSMEEVHRNYAAYKEYLVRF